MDNVLIYIIPVFIISLLMARNALFAIYDPMIVTIWGMSCSVGWVLGISAPANLVNNGVLLLVICSHFLFVGGLSFANRIPMRIDSTSGDISNQYLRIGLYFCATLLLLTTIIMARTIGLNILQENPDLARTTIQFDGAGILKRIIFAVRTAMVALVLILSYNKAMSRTEIMLFLVLASASMVADAAKGALYAIFTAYAYYLIYIYRVFKHKAHSQRRTSIAILLGFLVIIGAIGVSVIDIANSQNMSYGDALYGAINRVNMRFIQYGDIGYMFFERDAWTTINKTPVDFLTQLVAEPLAIFRLSPYPVSPGAEIYAIVTDTPNLEGRGPNLQVVFAGLLYFGVAGLLYSFLVGYALGRLRKATLRKLGPTNKGFFIYILLNPLIADIGIDLFLMLSRLYSLILLVPILIFVAFVYRFVKFPNRPQFVIRLAKK